MTSFPRARSAAAVLRGVALVVILAQVAGPVVATTAAGRSDRFSTCRPPGHAAAVQQRRRTTSRHFVAFDASLTIGLAESLRDTMVEDYEPTKLEMTLQDAVTPETDVIAFSQDYGNNGAAGWVYCPRDAPQGVNLKGHRWCQQQELHFNLNAQHGRLLRR